MTITRDQVLRTLKDIVAENPDRTAECFYSVEAFEGLDYEHTTPMCIVGEYVYRVFGEDAFKRLSVDGCVEPVWEFSEGEGGDTALLIELGVQKEGIDLLSEVQANQDHGNTWDDSLDMAL